jgi:hypothetical protein
LSNWTTYDAPFATKLRMAVSSTFIKLRRHQACCGNNGQPGVEGRPTRSVRADLPAKIIRTATGTTTSSLAEEPPPAGSEFVLAGGGV